MLVNIHHDTKAEHNRLLVAGVGFLIVILALISLSIAVYQKKFTPTTMVTVQANRAGLQLAKFGDVRMHGVLVGQVRSIGQDGQHAVIKLGLQPAAARNIPSNVTVQILPTTLFGQKYVSLVDPKTPSGSSLHNGQVIPASMVSNSVELENILANLFPLLRSIRPADLDTTLHALATALQGRGENLGKTFDSLDAYLTTFNKHLPTLKHDLVQLAQVSNTYALAAPDLIKLLRNATTTARTIASRKVQFGEFITSITSLASTGTTILKENGPGIVREGQLAAPLLQLLDTYSPEFPCLLEGSDRYAKQLAQIFRGNRVRQSMTLDAVQRRAYNASDRPVYGAAGHGPWCLGLPNNPPFPAPYRPLPDGSDLDEPGGK
ncbi:MAG: virulence factor Mce family protein [Marmoricola sp.]|jgi:phospholipid/cholesterol/gamma-HCH transport system substrate-binding protein|nr:virulence factor Mce family protein [Marmoricola sp.]